MCIRDSHYRDYDIILDTPALYQINNSALALEALIYLKEHQFVDFSDDDLLQGMYNARWAGRFEIINIEPLIIIDGAHNKEGIDAFYECAKKYDNIKIIFSALRLSLIHISEPTRQAEISYAVFCLKKKKKKTRK